MIYSQIHLNDYFQFIDIYVCIYCKSHYLKIFFEFTVYIFLAIWLFKVGGFAVAWVLQVGGFLFQCSMIWFTDRIRFFLGDFFLNP